MLISFNNTPFVHPNPSCPPYSPPPASLLTSTTLYFSISLPVCLYTRIFNCIHLLAARVARFFCPQRSSPQIIIHSSGAQPLGESHCWPLSLCVVTNPPGFSSFS